MKKPGPFSIAVAFVLSVALSATAQNSGPSANGDFHFTAGTAETRIVFDARDQNRGTTRGELVLTANQDPQGEAATFTLTAQLDCLKIMGNRAVMGGTVSSASIPEYLGVRVLLIVEDGGEGSKESIDRYTWGIYHGSEVTWLATDAELEFDPGAGLTWLATDAERNDDAGIPSRPSSTTVDCNSFAPSAYDLRDLDRGAGNIQVKP
jgi:hypothetical protein